MEPKHPLDYECEPKEQPLPLIVRMTILFVIGLVLLALLIPWLTKTR